MNVADKKFRVLHLRSSGGFYGAEAVLSSYFSSLHHSPVHMELLLLTGVADHPLLKRIHAPVHVLHASGGFSPAVFRSVRECVQHGAYDILHTHDYKSDIFGFLLRKQLTWVSTVHGWTRSDFKVRCYETLDRRVLPYAAGVAAVSRELYEQLGRLGLRREQRVYLPNAIDCDIFAPALRKAANSACRIATVARLSSEKATHVLLRAFAALPDFCQLAIIGDGPLRATLERLAQQLRIESRVSFLGVRNDIPALLAETDLFVLPSLREGTPMSLLEAMAAECTCVASAVGNIPQIIQPERTGLLVTAGDVTSLTAALGRLVADPPLRMALAKAARAFVVEHYSLPRLGEQVLTFYENHQALAQGDKRL
jgi:glycosyltransferase involved in cell wall biosynthesis